MLLCSNTIVIVKYYFVTVHQYSSQILEYYCFTSDQSNKRQFICIRSVKYKIRSLCVCISLLILTHISIIHSLFFFQIKIAIAIFISHSILYIHQFEKMDDISFSDAFLTFNPLQFQFFCTSIYYRRIVVHPSWDFTLSHNFHIDMSMISLFLINFRMLHFVIDCS